MRSAMIVESTLKNYCTGWGIEMTYRELIEQLEKLTEEQLECTVTVEDLYDQECYAADLAITGNGHDSLDEDHPIITFEKVLWRLM